MKAFKRIFTVALAGVLALAALTGCSGKSKASIEGTVTLKENGAVVFADAPFNMVTDGKVSYTKYEANGTVYETIATDTDSYSRTYAAGAADTKWTKTAVTSSGTASTEVKTGTMTIDGKEYTTQTYDDSTYYCLDGKSLSYIYTKSGDGEITIKITNMDTEIDESLLNLPEADEVE